MEFSTVKKAKEAELIQLSIWLFDNENERKVLEKMATQVIRNPNRKIMYVKNNIGSRIALFVNDIAERRY